MKISDFNYELPEELIAKYSLKERDRCRLLYLDRKRGEIKDLIFKDLVEILTDGDLIILNRTKVIPARIYGEKVTGGKVEILFVKKVNKNRWECMMKGRNLKTGTEILLKGIRVKVIKEKNRSFIEFDETIDTDDFIKKYGLPPLPPYIKREITKDDYLDYQTVFAEEEGSVAAPTAGLHFTKELLEELKKKGINISYITLHVGPGTFKPVKVEEIEKHKMDKEEYYISEKTISLIKKAKRVIAVGTTVTRALEDNYLKHGKLTEGKWDASIFIYPGFKFNVINGLITNFHLPQSTPLLLTSAFAGKELLFKAYRHAVKEKYRFLSYGDAMLIL